MLRLSEAPRNVRRAVYAREDLARKTGVWGDWQTIDVSQTPTGSGWMRGVHTVHKTDWLVVMVRTLACAWGSVDHAIIRTARNAELGWAEKQRIKDEIFGRDRCAVEVFPAADRVIDEADIYHLWVFERGMGLPFGLHERDAARTPARTTGHD